MFTNSIRIEVVLYCYTFIEWYTASICVTAEYDNLTQIVVRRFFQLKQAMILYVYTRPLEYNISIVIFSVSLDRRTNYQESY